MKTKDQLLVEKIHNEIDTAQDRLLAKAQDVINSTVITPETKLENKADRLTKLGFTSSLAVEKAKTVKENRGKKLKDIQVSKEQADLIQYYKKEYPLHKFLTEEELDRICDKYSLIHAPVKNYVKDIPEKNLIEIETMKEVEKKDIMPTTYFFDVIDWWNDDPEEKKRFYENNKDLFVLKEVPFDDIDQIISREEVGEYFYKKSGYKGAKGKYWFRSANVVVTDKSGYFIAAPPSHFNLDNLEKTSKHGYLLVEKIEVKDPIVFKYVKGGILVITKWGDEASDELLINEIDN